MRRPDAIAGKSCASACLCPNGTTFDALGRWYAMLVPPNYRLLVGLQTIVLTVVVLYFGQPILCPLVLAILLIFLIRPVVLWQERHGLPRAAAIVLVLLALLLGIGAVGGAVTGQLHELALHLDEYKGHIHAKLESLHGTKFKAFDNVRSMVFEVVDSLKLGGQDQGQTASETSPSATSQNQGAQSAQPSQPSGNRSRIPRIEPSEPQEVRIVKGGPSALDVLRMAWSTLSEPLTMVLVVLVLVIFGLAEFEELRNRVLRLAGQNKLTLTTRTLDDVGRRIGRYLLANAAVNGGFGFVWYLGLLAVGVDYAAFWGFLAAVLRFLPYIGAPCAAALAIGMAFIQFPDWGHPAIAAGIYLTLELITNYLIEPLTYGRTAGVSAMALLVAAVFWTWIWGPMGLLLSVPMTVALAVLGKHVPQFESLGILLGDEQALEPYVSFYQRLVAGDNEEAAALLEKELATAPRLTVYDRLFLPALGLAERDSSQGHLDQRDRDGVWHEAHDLLEENAPAHPENHPENSAVRLRIAGCPVEDPADELALLMLEHVLPEGCELTLLGMRLMTSEKVSAVCGEPFDAVVISDVGPGGDLQLRHLCKRIRQEAPDLRIVVGRWDYRGDRERMTANLRARGADHLVTRLEEAVDVLGRIQPLRPSPRSDAPNGANPPALHAAGQPGTQG